MDTHSELAGRYAVPDVWQSKGFFDASSRDWIYRAAETLLALALLSLFIPLKVNLGFAQIRPFEFLSVLLFGIALLRINRLPTPAFWGGLLIVLPYLAWHVISAFMYTAASGVRETLQIGAIAMFGFAVYVLLPAIRLRATVPILFFGMVAVTAYNVGYHVAAGQWFSWKKLDSWGTGDIKYTFQFLPPLVGLLMLFDRRRVALYWLIWAVLGVVIVLSGERKALLAYGLMTVAFLTRARVEVALPVLAVVFVLFSWVSSKLDQGYLAIQLNSVSNYSNAAGDSFDMIVRGAGPKSLSDSQRIFAFHVGAQMLEKHWLLGVGTNAYQARIRQEFSFAPDYVLLGIHGEFWRVLVENGAVGFTLYVLIWLAAASRLVKMLVWLSRRGAVAPYAARTMLLLILLPVFFSAAFEAAGTHAFVALLIASFSPELTYYALRDRMRVAPAEARSATPRAGMRPPAASVRNSIVVSAARPVVRR